MRDHFDGVFGAHSERFVWVKLQRLVGDQFKGDTLCERCEQELGFHQGEMVADADARSPAEGDIGRAGKVLLLLRGEALRAEDFRVGEVVWPMVHGVDACEDDIASAYGVAT